MVIVRSWQYPAYRHSGSEHCHSCAQAKQLGVTRRSLPLRQLKCLGPWLQMTSGRVITELKSRLCNVIFISVVRIPGHVSEAAPVTAWECCCCEVHVYSCWHKLALCCDPQPTLYIGPTRAPCGFVGFCVGPCMRAWYLTGTFRASPVRCGWRDNTSKPAFRPPSADRSPSACGYLSREAEYRMVLK